MGDVAHPTIRVHLVDLPRLLEDVVGDAFAGDPFELLLGPPADAPSAGTTVLIMRDGDPAAWMQQLLRRPDVSIVLIEPRACDARLVELSPSGRALGTVDTAALAAVARSAVGWEERFSHPDRRAVT